MSEVEELIKKAGAARMSAEAMQFAQAALSAAHALQVQQLVAELKKKEAKN